MFRLWRWLVVLAAAVLVLAVPAAARDLRGVALVIGEGSYTGLRPLDNPGNDARAMDDLLDGLGFDVSRVLDGDRTRLEGRIDRFVEDAADADVALIYYSGHGIEAGGKDYLVPVDADVSTPEKAGQSLVPVEDILDRLSKVVPVTIVLLDACRTNAFPEGTAIALPGSTQTIAVASTGLGELRGPTPVAKAARGPDDLGTVIGFSAAPGQAALDGPAGGNSPYAAALVKHLGAGGYSFNDLMTLVTEEVYLKTGAKQLPWVNSSLRRVLSFGTPATTAADADTAAIETGRRQLLLTIAALPVAERKEVETAAQRGGVPMDALYGLLAALGADVPDDPGALAKLLDAQTARLKQIMAEQAALSATDPEIVRLSGLAKTALAEGALGANVKFWEEAKARYAAVSESLDTTEAELKARRLEGGEVLASTGDAYMLLADYKAAAQNYALAFDEVKRWSDEAARGYKWAEAAALESEGDFKGDNAVLAASIAAYREALALTPRATAPDDWAGINSDLSIPLQLMAQRTGDPTTLSEAADAIRLTLEVMTPERDPHGWAVAENNLGAILNDLGYNAGDVAVVRQAVDAFRAALTVRTREARPTEWAMTQTNLGTALDRVGRLSGDVSAYEEAVTAYRAALEIETREADPFGWADNQTNMGISLAALGIARNERTLINEAADAFRVALEVRARDKVPLDWAASMLSLAWTEQVVGEMDGDAATLAKSEADYRAVLEEYQPGRVPAKWANAQMGLGGVLYDRGTMTQDEGLIGQAAAAFKAALTVWTEGVYPVNWANAQTSLGNSLWALGQYTEAADAYRASQKVYSRTAAPQKWALAESNIGFLTAANGYLNKDRAAVLAGKATVQAALDVFDTLRLEHDPAAFEERLKTIDEALAALDAPQ
jgi:uncharacterized caspase-like protein